MVMVYMMLKKNHQIVYLEVIGFKVYELYLKNKNVNSRCQGSQEALSGMAFGVESRWRGRGCSGRHWTEKLPGTKAQQTRWEERTSPAPSCPERMGRLCPGLKDGAREEKRGGLVDV